MSNNTISGFKPPARPTSSIAYCPTCLTTISGITTRGPGDHTLVPCGHALVPGALQDLATTYDKPLDTAGEHDE